MLIKDEKFIKGIIKEILVLQHQILLAGGFHTYSDEYCRYQFHIEHLLKKFDVPFTPENVKFLFDYPLSMVYDFSNPCNVQECPVMNGKMMDAFKIAVKKRLLHSYKKYPKMWAMQEKVEYVYSNLVMMSDIDPPIL